MGVFLCSHTNFPNWSSVCLAEESEDIRCQVHELQSRKQFRFLVRILKSGATCMHWSRCPTQIHKPCVLDCSGQCSMQSSLLPPGHLARRVLLQKAAVLFSPVGEASEVAHQCLGSHGMSACSCHLFSPSLRWRLLFELVLCLTSLFFSVAMLALECISGSHGGFPSGGEG